MRRLPTFLIRSEQMERLKRPTGTAILVMLALSAGIVALSFGGLNRLAQDKPGLPYDRGNPIVYDNDEAVDMYTDEYLLALASLGEIQLKGVITSSPIEPYDAYVSVANYERDVADRDELAANAKASGFQNIPDRLRGPMGNLHKPASGRIEDTRPIGAPGSRLIVAEAKAASPLKPLVIVAGSPLTAEADAYLLDPSIADKVIVAWLGGQEQNMCDYNGWADPWAAYIVLTKLRLVQFPLRAAPPSVPKRQLLDLPAGPLRDYMYHKHHPTNADPGDIDGDGPPAISVIRPDYVLAVKRIEFKRWVRCSLHMPGALNDEHEVPAFYAKFVYYLPWSRAEEGRALVVERSDPRVATREWWRAIRKVLAH
jgi:hypothetical protein